MSHAIRAFTCSNVISGGCFRYKSKADLNADMRLIFDNCETFNEDESPVGQSGHNLRAFFEKRWKELFEK